MEWSTELPESVIQNCLLTWQRDDGSRYITLNAILPNEKRHGIIAYMPIKHFINDNTGWKSEFKGDDLPKKNGYYLCCSDRPPAVSLYWFDAKKCTFGGSDKIIAFMDVPKPYLGKNMLKIK